MLSKNAKASLKKEDFENLKQQRMYEQNTEGVICPIKAYEMYVQKITATKYLFPKPCVAKRKTETWFVQNLPLGENSIDNLMSNLSDKLKLSKRYTNHCLRVTAITIFKENGKSNEEIASFTGHKNPQSIQRYCRKRRDESHQEMATILQTGFTESKTKLAKFGSGSIFLDSKMKMCEINERGDSTGLSMSINFSGEFKDCHFTIDKPTEKL